MDEEPRPGTRRMPWHREIAFWASAALVALGVVFYLYWGLSFGIWLDNGVYAVMVTLIGFGLAGMWLVSPDPPTPAATVPRT